jgi:hypothetical protein
MVLTKLLLSNVRKLPCKFQLFWASGSSENDFRKYFSYINTCKTYSPIMASSDPLGGMVLTSLILCNVIKLSCKFQFFWRSGSSSEEF